MIENDTFWSVTKSVDDQLILELKEQYEADKKAFLVLPIKSFYDIDDYNMFLYIEKWYTTLSMFKDEEILERFKKLGLNSTFLKWFIPLEEILSGFEKIEKHTEIKIFKGPALGIIKLHLNAKIRAELFQWGGYVTQHRSNPEANDLYKSFLNIYRQRKNGKKASLHYKDDYNKMMHAIIDQFEKELRTDINKEKFIKELSQGKSEPYYLKMMIDECFFKPQKMTQRKFLIKLYDLVSLLVKDFKMLSEGEYGEFVSTQIAGDEEFYTSHETYKYKRMKTIIYRK